MLNPGYRVIAKKEKFAAPPGKGFICPHCKKPVLEVGDDPKKFRTKCCHCRYWIYGEKIVENILK
jgi:hypothetical protein